MGEGLTVWNHSLLKEQTCKDDAGSSTWLPWSALDRLLRAHAALQAPSHPHCLPPWATKKSLDDHGSEKACKWNTKCIFLKSYCNNVSQLNEYSARHAYTWVGTLRYVPYKDKTWEFTLFKIKLLTQKARR